MKKLLKGILLALVAISLVFGVAGCGNSPSSLAKQYYDLGQEFNKLLKEDKTSGPEMEAYNKKMNEMNEKVAQLSGEDRAAFAEELKKLSTK